MYSNKTYLMRRTAVEGQIFYSNTLATVEHQRKYFPPTQNQPNYSHAPKIAIPFTSIFINKMKALLHNGLKVEFASDQQQKVWDTVADEVNWDYVSRILFVNSYVDGNSLAIILPGGEYNLPQIQIWRGQYVFIDPEFEDSVGYEYIKKNDSDLLIPVLSEPKNLRYDEQLVRVPINEYIFGNQLHNLGFSPAVMFQSVDMDDDGVYGMPYYLRYRDLNIEYNHIISQVSKAIKILQNVIVTNASQVNEDNPLRLDPDTINYVGADGRLEQMVRNLNTDPEHKYLSELLKLIHNAAQIPDFLSGLSGSSITNLDSGVALEIASAPLKEMMSYVRNTYQNQLTELVGKLMSCVYLFNGNIPPTFDFNVTINDNIIPLDEQREIDNVIKLVQNNIITPEQAQLAVLPLIKTKTGE